MQFSHKLRQRNSNVDNLNQVPPVERPWNALEPPALGQLARIPDAVLFFWRSESNWQLADKMSRSVEKARARREAAKQAPSLEERKADYNNAYSGSSWTSRLDRHRD